MHNNSSILAQAALKRILEENPYPSRATMSTPQENEGNAPSSTLDNNSNDNKFDREGAPSSMGTGLHQRMSQGGRLVQSGMTSNDAPTTTTSNNNIQSQAPRIPFYILPCISFGTGEAGRSNVKTAFALIFVPAFLLFFFVLDDLGRAITRNVKLRNNVSYLAGKRTGTMGSHNAGGVKNFSFERNTMNVWPRIQREVLVRQPEITLTIHGEDVEAMMKCPRGILFLFHGCTRYAASFYYSPQGRRIIGMANEAGLVTVAVTKNEETGCWDSLTDFATVKDIAKKWLKSRVQSCVGSDGTQHYPPIFGFGASSGGAFVEELASQMSTMRESFHPFVFSAINIQIMGPTPGRTWDIPTVFTVMQGDERTKTMVQDSIPILQASGSVGPFKVLTTSGRKTIGMHHFAFVFEDDARMTPELSAAVYQDLVGYGILDGNGALKGNPRNFKTDIDLIWQKHLNDRLEAESGDDAEVTPFGVSNKLVKRLRKLELEDANSIWLIEELNVAWDEHEITAEGFEEVITFMLDHSALPGSEMQAPPA
ncbi:hypothetical protein HJC23_008696 [Cyclotella cryptica]|uniref:Uncharacterized protein n=1 Tax=Cyclotella cryptica TaxID=29204 RepID=A0ABD3QGN5_9STRA|eukprot:CCRYP_005404-RA/>CCRYP_005404-RA protein AED:0.02 eAED:0.00 QI:0/-1/0/1/-1/1/1/0/537